MTHLYIITGTSKGLGKALTELLLQNEANKIIGLARNFSVSHSNYSHFNIDLADLETLKSFSLPDLTSEIKSVTLINNAGIIGEIGHVGQISDQSIIDTFTINTIAPALLMNKFIKKYISFDGEKTILNISSGAGKVPIDGWSSYCASKAAIDMFSKVADEESKIDKSNFKIFALSPGIIDTPMQAQIRSADKSGFSSLERFIEYKKSGELATPEETAEKVVYLLQNKDRFSDVLLSVRDY